MTTYYLQPEDALTDFLRSYLDDPSGRVSSDSVTFTASVSQNSYALSLPDSVSCITSITVDGTELKKWKEYFWDYSSNTITFFTALHGGEKVIVSYKHGSTDWIYSDRPDENLSNSSFPRISLFSVGGTGRKLGNYQAPISSIHNIQIDIWVREGTVRTISGKKFSNEYLARHISYGVVRAFELYENKLFGVFFDFEFTSIPRYSPPENDFDAHHSIVEVAFNAINAGKITNG